MASSNIRTVRNELSAVTSEHSALLCTKLLRYVLRFGGSRDITSEDHRLLSRLTTMPSG